MSDAPASLAILTLARVRRVLLWLGAGGTFLLIAVLMTKLIASGGLPSLWNTTLLLMVAIFMLSPFQGVMHTRRADLPQSEAVVEVIALALAVAVGAYVYLADWVFYNGPTRATGQGMVAVMVPMLQWGIVGLSAIVMWGIRSVRRFRNRRHENPADG